MRRLAATSVVLLAAATAATVDLLRGSPGQDHRAAEFQRTLGGLGTGPGLHAAGCTPALDLRLAQDCGHVLESPEAGALLCTHLGRPAGSAER